jgi:drug/metabolite transporter (DMT)-like permease
MILKIADILWLVSFPALMSVGQLLFRHSALQVAGRPLPELLMALVKMPVFLGAVLLYGLTTFLWVWLLGRYSLSIAYPFATLAVVAVPILEMTVFQQRLPSGYWLGLSLIIAGMLVIVRAKT